MIKFVNVLISIINRFFVIRFAYESPEISKDELDYISIFLCDNDEIVIY